MNGEGRNYYDRRGYSAPPSISPWQELANAIITVAANDVRSCRVYMHKYPSSKHLLQGRLATLKNFFYGEYIEVLTNLDGKKLFDRLMEEEIEDVKAEEERRWNGKLPV